MTEKRKPRKADGRLIRLPCFGITLQPVRSNAVGESVKGTIASGLKEPTCTAPDRLRNAAIDGLESLILALACAGIDVAAAAYVGGIETAVEAIANHL